MSKLWLLCLVIKLAAISVSFTEAAKICTSVKDCGANECCGKDLFVDISNNINYCQPKLAFDEICQISKTNTPGCPCMVGLHCKRIVQATTIGRCSQIT
ncbi:unnamed protein product [Gordionus sp. m RMFG-2023]